MASLKLEHIYKVYPNGHKAVSDFNMEIADGEFIVFVGPSGCGKSTTLRMIAGLEEISSGELYIGDTLVNDMQPKDRDIAMVFQNYALYPHMTVYENMAFGLTLRKTPRTEIHEKVMWAADILGLKDYLDRKPKAMSGGQRQRVSLGRAILRNPKVMLLDEPLSNLDAKLRSQMRSEISKLHQQLKTTFIYVTHDQVEAMTLGTRVVVMKLGRVQQIDSPQNLYDHPINKFVAGFIGTPQMNFFNVRLEETGDKVMINFTDCEQPALVLDKDIVLKAEKKYLTGTKDVVLGFRCEAITAEDATGDNVVDVTISHFEELGNETLIYGDLKEVSGLGNDSKTAVIIKASSKMGHVPGDVIKAKIDVNKIHLFDAETEMTIIPPVPSQNVLPVEIVNGKMNLFGSVSKPESIPVDLLQNGTITLPLDAIKVGEGSVRGKVIFVEEHKGIHLALVEVDDKKIFVSVDENVKQGDQISLFVDYSQATFKDANDSVIASPLADKDDMMASFVNFRTAYENTKDASFETIRNERVAKVTAEYEEKAAALAAEKEAALAEAKQLQDSLVVEKDSAKAQLDATNKELSNKLAAAKAEYKKETKELKAKHKAILKEELNAIEVQFKEMWAKEKADYKKAMETNKDPESRRSRKYSYSTFKESFPIMKANDIERKSNALEFDKESDLNAAKARFNQQKGLLSDEIEKNKREFQNKYFVYDTKVKEYEKKEKELEAAKKDALLHAQLIFFFKFDNFYQLIPDDITNKIIQGLGNRVFTKMFKVRVPHNAFVEEANGMEYEVSALANYGDAKMYKCVGQAYGEKSVVYVTESRKAALGEKIHIAPELDKTEIYENELNIRLY